MPLQRSTGRGRHHLSEDRLAHPLDLAEPRQSGQVVGLVPGRAPLPEQVVQGTGALRLTSRRVPKTASVKARSAARSRRRRPDGVRRRPLPLDPKP